MKEQPRTPAGEPDKRMIKAGIVRVTQQSTTSPKRPEREPQRIFKDEEKELKKRLGMEETLKGGRKGWGMFTEVIQWGWLEGWWLERRGQRSKCQEPRHGRVYSICPSLRLTLKTEKKKPKTTIKRMGIYIWNVFYSSLNSNLLFAIESAY